MNEIVRISKFILTYDVSLEEIVHYIRCQGFDIIGNPNEKIPNELLPQLKTYYNKRTKPLYHSYRNEAIEKYAIELMNSKGIVHIYNLRKSKGGFSAKIKELPNFINVFLPNTVSFIPKIYRIGDNFILKAQLHDVNVDFLQIILFRSNVVVQEYSLNFIPYLDYDISDEDIIGQDTNTKQTFDELDLELFNTSLKEDTSNLRLMNFDDYQYIKNTFYTVEDFEILERKLLGTPIKRQSSYRDDEEDIMRALQCGYGDIFGYE